MVGDPSERPCPREAEERGGVQHPLWRVPTDIHRADRQDTGSSPGRAPMGSQKGDVSASAIAEHVFAAGHQVDLSKATVIDTHPHAQTRCLLESWHIQHEQATPQ